MVYPLSWSFLVFVFLFVTCAKGTYSSSDELGGSERSESPLKKDMACRRKIRVAEERKRSTGSPIDASCLYSHRVQAFQREDSVRRQKKRPAVWCGNEESAFIVVTCVSRATNAPSRGQPRVAKMSVSGETRLPHQPRCASKSSFSTASSPTPFEP